VMVKAGATVLQPDWVQEAVIEGKPSQVLLAWPSWELLSVVIEGARVHCMVAWSLQGEVGGLHIKIWWPLQGWEQEMVPCG